MIKRVVIDNQVVLLDQADFDALPASSALAINSDGYPVIRGVSSEFRVKVVVNLHKFVLACPKGMVVDHIDGNKLNNTKANLRVCTYQQNSWNRAKVSKAWNGKPPSSKFKGVLMNKARGKWEARAEIPNQFYTSGRNKVKFLGYFKDELEAAKAVNNYVAEVRGEFGRLNNVA